VNAVRRVSALFALVAWIYAWFLFRGARIEYGAGDIGDTPTWLTVLGALGTTWLLASAIAAVIKFQFWPWMAIAGAVLVVVLAVGTQYAVMNSALAVLSESGSPRHATVLDAARAFINSRGAFELIVFITAAVAMKLGGLSALFLGRSRKPHLREVAGG
jgi:hypothetical protein